MLLLVPVQCEPPNSMADNGELRIETYQDTQGLWRWRAVAYNSPGNATKAITRLAELFHQPLTVVRVSER